MTHFKKIQNENKPLGAVLYVGKCLHIFLITLSFYLSWRGFYAGQLAGSIFLKGNLVIAGLFVFLFVLLVNLYNGYAVPFFRVSEMVYSQSLAAILSDFILFVVIALLAGRYVSVLPLLLTLCSQVIISALWSFFSRKLYFSVHPPLRAVLIRDEVGRVDFSTELKKAEGGFKLIDEISISEYLHKPERYLEEAEAIFLMDIYSGERDKVVKDCMNHGVSLYLFPSISDALVFGGKSVSLFYHPLVEIKGFGCSMSYLFIKRCMDITISVLALLILAPLMAVVALLIRRDGGPIFYKQTRLTKGGRTFEILKFRSMTVDAESDGVARLSTGQSDSRVTPIGRIIRRFRIDELPQLFNTLRGEMSIVGPRPERPELAAEYEKTLPEFSLRLQMKAGLTGYAQVYGKYNTTPHEKLLMDLQYMSHPSFMEDIKILFITLKVLFMKESTDGLQSENGATMEKTSAEAAERSERQ